MKENQETQELLTSEQEIINKLLETDTDQVPTKNAKIDRLGIVIKMQGLTGKKVYAIREQCTYTVKGRKGAKIEKLDEEAFDLELVAASCVTPNWNDPQLLTKYKASSAAQVIKKVLLAGEINALSEVALDLSGYNIDVDEVKN